MMLEVLADVQAHATVLRRLEVALADLTQHTRAVAALRMGFRGLWAGRRVTYRQQCIRRLLAELNLPEDCFQIPFAQLSGGQRTRAWLWLAGLLLEAPDLLFLDEPTGHLDLAALEWLEGYLES